MVYGGRVKWECYGRVFEAESQTTVGKGMAKWRGSEAAGRVGFGLIRVSLSPK